MILVINCGSSSIRFGVYNMDADRLLKGKIDHIGSEESSMRVEGAYAFEGRVRLGNAGEAAGYIVLYLEQAGLLSAIRAVGHRIVHGRNRKQAVLIYDAVRAELEGNRLLAPVHMLAALTIIDSMRRLLPGKLHVACFDTAFHTDLPEVARMMPLPRHLIQKGIVRYGFHGLSCTYLLRAFEERAGEKAASGRLIIAHLGSGASMTAVKGMKSVDTTMGFTPEGGLMMGTRPGDMDPGILTYLTRAEGLGLAELEQLIQAECGLLGVSATTADMGRLLKAGRQDTRAKQAVDLFCYRAQKALCGLCGALGGLDAVIFSGGIGENFPQIRAQICKGLGFLGISLDETGNMENAFRISRPSASTQVYVIPTDEERIIAEQTLNVIANAN
ncbi:acetate kinase [Dyadobacter sp. BE34]|uniref:Acetate kinase n=1 Tax=Dyadobacter fermentans TaxID=94254 RepID=A0ABU1QXT9_9BACT|nr:MULTISPECIES: acetate/propionate family kinase [Dyadobacter]MDR6805966.1 acetate kinase [Dyadobacter fermentans]MDR7043706.1 acetate kinase [Dyadobacter sp. BE242]MDR7198018.1 acetate kinase [Dyadobacter sp. BE34]MDR7215980.1 acetate kinase [Dyadobacter sp. BE31]MDR7264494.1 acetate kinase [Dyadobacter sp. BE32]